MRALVVDDLRSFTSPEMLDFLGIEEVVYARTSQEAIPLLEKEWNMIFLDHDLGYASHGSGSVVCEKLCELAHGIEGVPGGTVYVHTSNPYGGDQMMLSLKKYGYDAIRIDAFVWGLRVGYWANPYSEENNE